MEGGEQTQQTVDFVGQWGGAVKTCAKSFGKGNFFIPGEITGGNTFGSLYIGARPTVSAARRLAC